MKKFPDDTKDIIEQLYASKILENFPLYGKFWEEFIGVRQRKGSGRLLPYGLKFDSSYDKNERERIEQIYEEITMTHYSLFLALAGAHFQVDEMQKILKWEDYKRRYFSYWEAFEVCYIHLGSTIYQVENLWKLYFRLCGSKVKKIKPKLEKYFEQQGKKHLWKDMKKTVDKVKVLRNNIVHFVRCFNWPIQEGFLIPYRIAKNSSWTNQQKIKEKILSHIKAKDDLMDVERMFNEVHEILIKNLLQIFKQNKIQICN